VLLRGIIEATEVDVPTTFVILQEELLSKTEEEELKHMLLNVGLKEDGSGFDCRGVLGEKVKRDLRREENG